MQHGDILRCTVIADTGAYETGFEYTFASDEVEIYTDGITFSKFWHNQFHYRVEVQMANSKLPGSEGEKILQDAFKTTASALAFYNKQMITHLSGLMQEFIAKQEMMFISTADSKGECDASFRAGKAGFVTVLDEHHLLYPEYKGNGVMASMGNIHENPNIGLLFLDFFETKVGLHVNGKARIILKENLESELQGFPQAFKNIKENADIFKIVSYVLVEVEEAYIHCSLHIPMLQKADPSSYEHKFPKYSKGGDAFEVADIPRHWSAEALDKKR